MYFVTSATYSRRRLFEVQAPAELFLETLQHYRREGRYKLRCIAIHRRIGRLREKRPSGAKAH